MLYYGTAEKNTAPCTVIEEAFMARIKQRVEGFVIANKEKSSKIDILTISEQGASSIMKPCFWTFSCLTVSSDLPLGQT